MVRIRTLAAVLVLLGAFTASAAVETVLTSKGLMYSVDGGAEAPRLMISRRSSDTVTAMLVPATDDATIECQARLLWDDVSSRLFVIWNHRDVRGDEILMTTYDESAGWSEPIVIASAAGLYRDALQVVLTRAEIPATDGTASDAPVAKATLIHAAWWSLDTQAVAEYALVAFEGKEHVSTQVDTLDSLGDFRTIEEQPEPGVGIALHPPMAMARATAGVDIAYGRTDSSALRRIHVDPVRVVSDARFWRPAGKYGERTGRTGLVAATSAPVEMFIDNGRIVLYAPSEHFRYMVYENGHWSPIHMIQLDESLTSSQLVEQLHRSVNELTAAPVASQP